MESGQLFFITVILYLTFCTLLKYCFPSSSAHVERCFSLVKRCLGEWKISLNVNMLDALLRISLDRRALSDYDPEKALNLWHNDSIAGCRADFSNNADSN